MSKVCYWDSASHSQKERDATPAEEAEIAARKAAPPPVPDTISPRQFRQSLSHSGFRATVEAAIAAADQDTKDWYSYATAFERNHPKVLSMAQALGYTPAQIDAVWTHGASI